MTLMMMMMMMLMMMIKMQKNKANVKLQVVGSRIIYGTEYKLLRWMSGDGKIEEAWIPSTGFDVNPTAFDVPTMEVESESSELAFSCNTSKEKNVQRQKIAGVNIVSFPCGTIVDVQELYGSESLTQVLLPLHTLMKIPSIKNDVRVLIHDNACRFSAFVQNRGGTSSIMQHIAS